MLPENSFFRCFFLIFICLSGACANESTDQKPLSQSTEVSTESDSSTTPKVSSVVADTNNLQYEDGAIVIDWKMLADVTFEDAYNEEVKAYVPYPTFGRTLRAIEGRMVQIEGYIIPLEETGDETILVLSAQPYSNCFFCGGAGAESVMDIKLKKGERQKFTTDDRVVFRGKLRLNDSDLYYLNYILEEAEVAD